MIGARPRRLRGRHPRRAARAGRRLRRAGASASAAPACASAASPARRCSSRASASRRPRDGLGDARRARSSGVELDLAAMLTRKDAIVDTPDRRASPGCSRRTRSTRYHGRGRLAGPGRVVVVGSRTASVELSGAARPHRHRQPQPRRCPASSSTATASAPAPRPCPGPRGPRAPGRDRRGLHRPGARLGLAPAGRQGHRARVPRPHPARHGRRDRQPRRSRLFEKQGLEFRLGVPGHRRAAPTASGCVVESEGHEPLACDRVLLAVGRMPNTDGLGLDDGRHRDRRARPRSRSTSTSQRSRRGRLRHRRRDPRADAGAQGRGGGHRLRRAHRHRATATSTTTRSRASCYTEPEIASVGKTEEELEAAGRALPQGRLPLPRQRPRPRARPDRRPGEDPGRTPRPTASSASTSSARAPAT